MNVGVMNDIEERDDLTDSEDDHEMTDMSMLKQVGKADSFQLFQNKRNRG